MRVPIVMLVLALVGPSRVGSACPWMVSSISVPRRVATMASRTAPETDIDCGGLAIGGEFCGGCSEGKSCALRPGWRMRTASARRATTAWCR